MADTVTRQEAAIAALEAAPAQYDIVRAFPARLKQTLTAAATCTERSAALYSDPCSGTAVDTDRDGLSDSAEVELVNLVEEIVATAPASDPRLAISRLDFDPTRAFTTSSGPTPIPDLDEAAVLVTDLNTIDRDLRLTTENLDRLLTAAEDGLAAVVESQEARRYAVDIVAVANEAFAGDVGKAGRAIGLYNAYCARCHTAGYSAGVAFTREAGSGAMGPSLREGRAVVQFPDIEDHYDFVVAGSTNGIQYGVNGIGRGWMPGFGAMLTEEDIMLIVIYERSLG